MKAIDNKELEIALETLEKEKGIKKEYLIEQIEAALITAYKNNYKDSENVKVVVDPTTGETHIYSVKEIVEKVENPVLQITKDEASTINKQLEIGDTVDIELNPRNFGRIAAQTAKQVIIQKLREAERDIVFGEFNEPACDKKIALALQRGESLSSAVPPCFFLHPL